MKRRKVCVITGSRAEYGSLRPVISKIRESSRLGLLLAVAGMHLSEEFGGTVRLIKKDGFRTNCKIMMNPTFDSAESMSLSIGRGIIEITRAFGKISPEITLVLGDRIEALAGAIASAYLNIPVAHIHGGDISKAGLDESARHAITKLSHIHFAASSQSRERIIRMGERPKNVFLVGAPGLDTILKEPLLSADELEREVKIKIGQPFVVVLQHSVTTQIKEARFQMAETMEAVRKLRIPAVVIYPNSDSGGRAMINEIQKYRNRESIKIFKSLPHKVYLSLLKYARALIGNSSSAIIETASFKLPAVNIGLRQDKRQRSTNVIDVGHKSSEIIKAVRIALYDRRFRKRVQNCFSPYGDGSASRKIVKVLETIRIDRDLLQKQITY